MALTPKISKNNFRSFLWHASFLAFAQSFIDVDTVLPAMIIEAGGGAMQIGIMTAILLGGSSLTQLLFAPYLSNQEYKKKFLLLGINSRILSLAGLAVILYYMSGSITEHLLPMIFMLITVFALGGAFANVSYMDIFGKSVAQDKRKPFFSVKQVLSGIIVLVSAIIARKVLSSSEYPLNYSYMFFIGFGGLLFASFGFWKLKEVSPSLLKIRGFSHFGKTLISELKNNKKLGWFLGFVNTMGIAVSFLPFVILYAKNTFSSESVDTGNFLLFKIIGSVSVGFLILMLSGKVKYRVLLYINTILAVVLPLSLIVFITSPPFYFIFLVGGVIYSIYSITMNGILLEISGNENRVLYTGFAGAGNILPALFPLLGAFIIDEFGFTSFFIVYMIIVSLSIVSIIKLKCKK